MADEPSAGEIMRRIEQVASQLTELSIQMRDDRLDAARTFVRRDLYLEQAGNRDRRLDDLEADRDEKEKDSKAFRRQMLFLILGIAIPAIGGLLLSISIFLATQGAGSGGLP